MIRLTLPLLVLLAVLLPGAPARADFAGEQLLAAADPEHERHADALAWWQGQAEAEKIRLLRKALQSDNLALARIAAGAVGYPYLDAAEMRRKMSLLLRARPLHVFVARQEVEDIGFLGRHVFGADDVLPFWRAVVQDPESPESDRLQTAHRALRTEHADALVPLLEPATAKVFEDLLWTIGQIGEADRQDRRRAVVARGWLYGLLRLRTERAAKPPPKLADVQVEVASATEGGLPAAYVAIAAASHPDARDGFEMGDPNATLSIRAPFHWLRRWTLDLTPGPQDIPYLLHLIGATLERTEKRWQVYGPAYPLWAMRALAGMPGEAGRARVEAWAKEANARGAFAAAALAERGSAGAFHALLAASDAADKPLPELDELLWLVDREEAGMRAVQSILGAPPEELGAHDVLAPEERMWLARTDAIEITDADVRWIGDELWRRDAQPRTLAWFHAAIDRGSLTAERTTALLARLREPGPGFGEEAPERLVPVLAEMERIAPQALRDLLSHWVGTQPQARDAVLPLLARLGVTGHEDAMLAAWETWPEDMQWVLGHVRGERVRTFLREKAGGEDGELTLPALQALLVHHGLPARAARILDTSWDVSEEDRRAPDGLVQRMLAAFASDDPVGAALVAAEQSGLVHLLGHLTKDARVVSHLRRLQRERHRGLYWQATAGLAIGGDAAARQEYLALLASDRTSILDQLGGDGGSLGADPALTALLTERLDSNCCLGWAAHVLLDEIYPLPFDSGYGGAGTVRTRAWIAARDWKRSLLSDTLVPARR